MASNGEGASISQPPIFNGTNYALWKDNMKRYIKFINTDLWKVIKKGISLNQAERSRKELHNDCRAKNIIST